MMLIHKKRMPPSHRNQPPDIHSKPIDWFLHNENIGLSPISYDLSIFIAPDVFRGYRKWVNGLN